MNMQESFETFQIDQETVFPCVEEALNNYHNSNIAQSPFEKLLLFKIAARTNGRSLRQATNQVLMDAYEALQKSAPEDALFIEKRFFDQEIMSAVARRLSVSEGYIFTIRKRAIQELTNILLAQEQELRQSQQQRWAGRLPAATYRQLFGVKGHLDQLYETLLSPTTSELIIVEGIGGIGKTSLIHALIHKLMQEAAFDDFGWLSLKTKQLTPQGMVTQLASAVSSIDSMEDELVRALLCQLVPEFPAFADTSFEQCLQILQGRLTASRHLIVVDNIEEQAEAEALWSILQKLMGQSRFLVTSRVRFPSLQPAFVYTLQPLSQSDGITLLRSEAKQSNITHIGNQEESTLNELLETVGGNPLALKLVVGLAHSQDIQTILGGLRAAPTTKIDELYRYIYQQSWQRLDEPTKTVFIYMPIAALDGDPLSTIVEGVGLPKAEVQNALDNLVDLNLVDVHRGADEYRFGIHSLTRTFLLNDAIDW